MHQLRLAFQGRPVTSRIMKLAHDLSLSRRPLAGFLAMGLIWATFAGQVPVIKAQIDASDAVYGTAVLLGSIGALAAIWIAPFADRVAGRYAIIIGTLLMCVGFLIVGVAGGVVMFVTALLIASVGAGITDVLVNADLSEREAASGRALMNLNHGLFSFAYAGGALLTGRLREAQWQPPAIFALLAVLLCILCLFMRRRSSDVLPDENTTRATTVPWAFVVSAGVVVMVAFLAEAATEGWSALHLERTLGGGAAQGAMGPAILGLSMGFGRLGGHWLSNRLPDVATMSGALLFAAMGLCLAGLAPNLGLAYLGFGLAGLGMSVVGPLGLSLLGRSVPPKLRLLAMSRASAIAYFAFFIGPSLMGYVSQGFGLRMAFIVVAAVLMLVAVLLVPAFGRQAARLRSVS